MNTITFILRVVIEQRDNVANPWMIMNGNHDSLKLTSQSLHRYKTMEFRDAAAA